MGVCWCKDGTYATRGHRWRRLIGSLQLKCLDCGCKWYTNRQYASRLAEHREQNRTGLTDADIVSAITSGRFWYLEFRGEVHVFSRRRRLTTIPHKRYDFVSLCLSGKKKKVAVHRFVMMFHLRAVVPEGCDVDHRRQTLPRDNRIENLRLLEIPENRRRNNNKSPETSCQPGFH